MKISLIWFYPLVLFVSILTAINMLEGLKCTNLISVIYVTVILSLFEIFKMFFLGFVTVVVVAAVGYILAKIFKDYFIERKETEEDKPKRDWKYLKTVTACVTGGVFLLIMSIFTSSHILFFTSFMVGGSFTVKDFRTALYASIIISVTSISMLVISFFDRIVKFIGAAKTTVKTVKQTATMVNNMVNLMENTMKALPPMLPPPSQGGANNGNDNGNKDGTAGNQQQQQQQQQQLAPFASPFGAPLTGDFNADLANAMGAMTEMMMRMPPFPFQPMGMPPHMMNSGPYPGGVRGPYGHPMMDDYDEDEDVVYEGEEEEDEEEEEEGEKDEMDELLDSVLDGREPTTTTTTTTRTTSTKRREQRRRRVVVSEQDLD